MKALDLRTPGVRGWVGGRNRKPSWGVGRGMGYGGFYQDGDQKTGDRLSFKEIKGGNVQ